MAKYASEHGNKETATRFSQCKIPPDLIINWDQNGSKLVPVGEWTMAGAGSKQVQVVGKEDKRVITVFLTISASGLLPLPKVI